MLAPGHIHPLLAIVSIVCIALGAASAAIINMWYDRDIDAIMSRTKQRPIVTGAISSDEALAFGIVIGFFAILLMALCINYFAAFLLLTTILYYIFIYTIWLKRSHKQNIVIGGVAGALPPLIGWACVTGDVSIQSFTLFMIIFLWTPPHSWALALYRIEDYKNSNIPMLPVVMGNLYTIKQISLYSVLMVICTLIPFFLQIGGVLYLIIALISNIIFLYYVFVLFYDKTTNGAKRLFIYSIFYLFTIFFSLLI
jgi:protoheme IX farnesyltransferase